MFGNSEKVFVWNEPPSIDQSNIPLNTPEEIETAINAWNETEQLYGDQFKLVSPSVLPWQTWWLKKFVTEYFNYYQEYPNLSGGLALHCYGGGGVDRAVKDCEEAIYRMAKWADQWGAPKIIYVSEFGYWGTKQEALEFMGKMIPVFEEINEEGEILIYYFWFQDYYRGNEPWAPPTVNTSLRENPNTDQGTVFGEMYGKY